MHRCDSWAKEHNHIFMGAISRRWGGFISVEIEEFKSAVPVAWRGHLATGDEPINYSQRGMWPSVKGIRSSLQSCPVKKPQDAMGTQWSLGCDSEMCKKTFTWSGLQEQLVLADFCQPPLRASFVCFPLSCHCGYREQLPKHGRSLVVTSKIWPSKEVKKLETLITLLLKLSSQGWMRWGNYG